MLNKAIQLKIKFGTWAVQIREVQRSLYFYLNILTDLVNCFFVVVTGKIEIVSQSARV